MLNLHPFPAPWLPTLVLEKSLMHIRHDFSLLFSSFPLGLPSLLSHSPLSRVSFFTYLWVYVFYSFLTKRGKIAHKPSNHKFSMKDLCIHHCMYKLSMLIIQKFRESALSNYIPIYSETW